MAAFRLALALGADGVELDARRSADDGVLVHHDAAAAGVGPLVRRSAEEVRADRPGIPTLDEALDACAGALVNVELKNLPGQPDFDPDERLAALVADVLARRAGRDDVLVSSFSLDAIDRFRSVAPAVPTALLTLRGFDLQLALSLAADRGHRALHPDVRAMRRGVAGAFVEQAHGLGLGVHVWTVNRPPQLARLAREGVDAVITDVPDVARDVLDAAVSPSG